MEEDLSACAEEVEGCVTVVCSVMTLNTWTCKEEETGVVRPGGSWEMRRRCLQEFLAVFRPDVLCIQEAHPEIVAAALEALPTHVAAVEEEKAQQQEEVDQEERDVGRGEQVGWGTESQIFWHAGKFSMMANGAEDCIQCEDHPDRKLFWVRLRPIPGNEGEDETFFVGTAHFPWAGSVSEVETGLNSRVPVAQRTAEALARLVRQGEPAVFGGDLNEDFHPSRILRERCGFVDCFRRLQMPAPATHPMRPSSVREEARPSRTVDWLTSNDPARPICCSVVDHFSASATAKELGGDAVLPHLSDHAPVLAVFEMRWCNSQCT